jgi:hypothetical protein
VPSRRAALVDLVAEGVTAVATAADVKAEAMVEKLSLWDNESLTTVSDFS